MTGQELFADPQLVAVLRFMQQNVEASKLASVARIIGDIAPVVWGRTETDETLVSITPIQSCHGPQPAATQWPLGRQYAYGDSVVEEHAQIHV